MQRSRAFGLVCEVVAQLLRLHIITWLQKMEKDFQEHLKRLEEEFMTERNLMIKTHAEQRKVSRKLKGTEISEQEIMSQPKFGSGWKSVVLKTWTLRYVGCLLFSLCFPYSPSSIHQIPVFKSVLH